MTQAKRLILIVVGVALGWSLIVLSGGCGCEAPPLPPAPEACDSAAFAGWWDLGDEFGSCSPFARMTRLDGGQRPGADCAVLEAGWAEGCALVVEEVCQFDTGYIHTVATAAEPADGRTGVSISVEMYALDHRPVCFGSFDVVAERADVL